MCLLLLIVAALYVFKQRRPELFAKTFGAAEEKLRSMAIDAGRKDIDILAEGNDIAKRLAEANALSVATDGLGGVAAVGTGANTCYPRRRPRSTRWSWELRRARRRG